MLNDEQLRMKSKLQAQVKRFEEKGYFDTAAHQVLARLLEAEKQSAEDITPRNTRKVKQEAVNGKQDL